MKIVSISGIAFVCAYGAEWSSVGNGMASGQHGPRPRPRPDALLTLDPTQRPSAPPRWET